LIERFSDLDLDPAPRQLRIFAAILGVFCIAVIARSTTTLPRGLGIAGVIVALLGLAIPAVIRPVYQLLTIVTFPIGWLVTKVVLTIVFYLVVTPTGIVLKLLRRDPLRIRRQRDRSTYWVPSRSRRGAKSYLQQY
jgi:hypothetical protein